MGWQKRLEDDLASVNPRSAALFCSGCGRPLGGDPEDDPTGEAGMPICGECNRSRDLDADLEMLDASDGTLDGNIDW